MKLELFPLLQYCQNKTKVGLKGRACPTLRCCCSCQNKTKVGLKDGDSEIFLAHVARSE